MNFALYFLKQIPPDIQNTLMNINYIWLLVFCLSSGVIHQACLCLFICLLKMCGEGGECYAPSPLLLIYLYNFIIIFFICSIMFVSFQKTRNSTDKLLFHYVGSFSVFLLSLLLFSIILHNYLFKCNF